MTELPVLTITLLPKTRTQKVGYASEKVDLRNANISVIPKHLFTTFRNVIKLDLSRNGLDVLPDAIGECVALEELLVSNNRLKTLPITLVNCTKLCNIEATENAFGDNTVPFVLLLLKQACIVWTNLTSFAWIVLSTRTNLSVIWHEK